ncbi:hypothetical protein PRZ48_008202 [Zasmidium cellare]|uniref:TUG ubiquitin-like domain-containing protein n=1 Tax=Zasmidium cellare TaxID=395010 RepID=A0ABR0EFK5_ZASCE|nr:hypothetical protein PRZ48_008202 [Zasmidium cellare]
MASGNVFVLDSGLKRTQIKVSPGKYLREVLEEACKARKWDPEAYTLKTQNNKIVDLSQPWRLSGLTTGAKLQLVQGSRSPSVVNLALQLPESEGGTRLSDKFPSTTSLWLVLRKYEDGVAGGSTKKLNLTQRGVPSKQSSGSGRLEYEQPVLNILGRNLETFPDLQKTLAQLGVNGGSVLIRLSFKNSGQPLDEAMKEIGQFFNSVDTVPAGVGSSASQGPTQDAEGAHAVPAGNLQSQVDSTADNAAVPREGEAGPEPAEPDTAMTDAPTAQPVQDDVLATSSETQPQPSEPPSNVVNGISVYRPPSSRTPAAALQPDDPTAFEPSIEHAKAHQASLERAGKNTRLLSDKELEEQETARQARLASVQTVTVRVRYPDQSMIETTIQASDTAADLYAKVMGTLAQAPEPFELRYTGQKGHQTIPNASNQRLVRDLGFKGKVLVNLLWAPDASMKARQGPSLKEEYRSKAQDLKVDLQAQQAQGEQGHKVAMAKKDAPEPSAGGGKGKGDLEAKMKKFLGFGKK